MGEFYKLDDLTGKRFGRLTVAGRSDDYVTPSTGKKRAMWRCVCDCGSEKIVMGSNLKRGITKSCGCLMREELSMRKKTHSGWANNEKLYGIWCGMRKRCNSEKSKKYKDYGGRGIKICDEWNSDYSAFRDWSMSNGYKDGLSIDRIDVDGWYSPENCRWADNITQQNNKRNTIIVEYNGVRKSLKEWSKYRGINYRTLYQRYKYGWDIARMLNYCD